MNKLTDNECKIANNFNEYFRHLEDSGLIKGVTGEKEETRLFFLNVGLAIALTVLKGDGIDDYFV